MDLPDPGINPGSPALQADSLPTELSGADGSSVTVIAVSDAVVYSHCLSPFSSLALLAKGTLGWEKGL